MEQLGRISVEEFKLAPKSPVVVVLDNVRSAMNVGAVFRTCDAFRVEKIFLCGITAQPPNNEIHKTAIGAEEAVDWEFFKRTIDAINLLKSLDYQIISIEQAKESILLQNFKIEKDKKYVIVLGNEVKGVEQEVMDSCNYCVEIAQFGTKHSLNVSVCAGVVLWEFCGKFL